MARWALLDYVEVSGRNPIREWLDALPDEDQAKIDFRLVQMAGMPRWPEKWISKYQGTELFEFRITGNRVQYRPLGIYYGTMRYVILCGATERDGKIPKSTIETAEDRLARLRQGKANVVRHQFDDAGDLEEDGQEGLS